MQANLRSVSARRAAIAVELARLQSEDAELEGAEAVLERLSGSSTKPNGAHFPRGVTKAKKKASLGRPPNGTSQRELILTALKRSKTPWLKVVDIIAAVKSERGIAMPARSISPLMSNLKKTKVIVRKGRLVALKERAK